MKKKSLISLLGVLTVMGVSGALIYDFNMPANVNKAIEKKADEKIVKVNIKKDEVAPVITGEKNWEVELGSTIDVLEGVNATDDVDGSVKVMATAFSTEKEGKQTVTLTAEDKAQNKTTKEITVNVVAPVVAAIEEPVEVATDNINQESSEVPAAPVYVEEETPVVAQVEPVESQEVGFSASTMYVGGLVISYQNAGEGSGQSVIDNNPNVIATWGGAATQSGNDGLNTHFIGHNPGIFSVLFQLGGGETITVTDGAGTPTNYVVSQIFQVDDYGTGITDGQEYMDLLIGTGGGERITLQTCINDSVNLIVIATAA